MVRTKAQASVDLPAGRQPEERGSAAAAAVSRQQTDREAWGDHLLNIYKGTHRPLYDNKENNGISEKVSDIGIGRDHRWQLGGERYFRHEIIRSNPQ